MEPANSIIKKFGGPRAVSELIGINVSQVYKWAKPKEIGGTDGLIPMHRAVVLLAEAKKRGLDITADSFFPSDDNQAAGDIPLAEDDQTQTEEGPKNG